MAMKTEEIVDIINAVFPEADSFAQMMKLLGGVGARLKLEVQRDAANRAVNELHQQTQTVSQTKQAELTAALDALNAQIAVRQQEAAQLQAAIDALNAQLPDLLQ